MISNILSYCTNVTMQILNIFILILRIQFFQTSPTTEKPTGISQRPLFTRSASDGHHHYHGSAEGDSSVGKSITIASQQENIDAQQGVGWVRSIGKGALLQQGKFGLGNGTNGTKQVPLEENNSMVTGHKMLRGHSTCKGELSLRNIEGERGLKTSQMGM